MKNIKSFIKVVIMVLLLCIVDTSVRGNARIYNSVGSVDITDGVYVGTIIKESDILDNSIVKIDDTGYYFNGDGWEVGNVCYVSVKNKEIIRVQPIPKNNYLKDYYKRELEKELRAYTM